MRHCEEGRRGNPRLYRCDLQVNLLNGDCHAALAITLKDKGGKVNQLHMPKILIPDP